MLSRHGSLLNANKARGVQPFDLSKTGRELDFFLWFGTGLQYHRLPRPIQLFAKGHHWTKPSIEIHMDPI